MKKNAISIVLIVVAIGLSVWSWFHLPETVAAQVGFDGQVTNTMPKALAVAVPLMVAIVGAGTNLAGLERKKMSGTVILVMGLAGMVLNLLINR